MVTPFSQVLAMIIMRLVVTRDQELRRLKGEWDESLLTTPQFDSEVERLNSRLADDILATCQKEMARLESTVDSILQIQEQMRLIRSGGV